MAKKKSTSTKAKAVKKVTAKSKTTKKILKKTTPKKNVTKVISHAPKKKTVVAKKKVDHKVSNLQRTNHTTVSHLVRDTTQHGFFKKILRIFGIK
jgi:hypothetical protein